LVRIAKITVITVKYIFLENLLLQFKTKVFFFIELILTKIKKPGK